MFRFFDPSYQKSDRDFDIRIFGQIPVYSFDLYLFYLLPDTVSPRRFYS